MIPNEAKTASMLDKAVFVLVKMGRLGNSKKMRPEDLKDNTGRTVEMDADVRFIRASKTLMDAPELACIRKLDTEIRSYVYRQCLPSFTMEGIYLLPHALLEETEAKLSEFRELRRKLVDDFLMVYQERVQEAAAFLRTAYNPQDYPNLEEAAQSFTMEWRYLTFNVPEALKEHGDLYQQEQEKHQAEVVEIQASMQQRMRETFRSHIDLMVYRLDGERHDKHGNVVVKIFRNSLVTNAVQFLTQFTRAFSDVVSDPELTKLVALAQEMLTEVEPDDLRRDKDLRENLVAGLKQVQSELDSLGVKPAKLPEEEAA